MHLNVSEERVAISGKLFCLAGRKWYLKGLVYGPFAPGRDAWHDVSITTASEELGGAKRFTRARSKLHSSGLTKILTVASLLWLAAASNQRQPLDNRPGGGSCSMAVGVSDVQPAQAQAGGRRFALARRQGGGIASIYSARRCRIDMDPFSSD